MHVDVRNYSFASATASTLALNLTVAVNNTSPVVVSAPLSTYLVNLPATYHGVALGWVGTETFLLGTTSAFWRRS